ncbi:MAG TPA: glycosyltransferase family 39 protein [Candidatus Polarisedimenticolia bacterium]|nr:glycosyltransferase family 39 protein [Candidatus Polarisedimenticolia bacterium]
MTRADRKNESKRPGLPGWIPPIVARLGIPLAAGVGFAAQFLVSLRTEKAWVTILPGVFLYLVAFALLGIGMRAGAPGMRTGAAGLRAGAPGRGPGESPRPLGPDDTTVPGGAGRGVLLDFDAWLRGNAEWWLFGLILVGGLWLRLYRIDLIPWGLNNDEAINAIEANEIAQGKKFATVTERGLNRETMFHEMAAVSYRNPGLGLNVLRALPALFGLNTRTINDPLADATFPLRVVSIFVAMLTLVALYFFARAFFGARVALVAMFFLAVSPWHLLYSRVGERTILAPLFMLLTAGLFLRALPTGRIADHLLWGLALGLGFWTYTTFRAVPIAIAAFWVWRTLRRRTGWDFKPLLAGAGLAAAGFLFVMLFSGMSPLGFLLRGAYAATPPKTNWALNLFHAVTMPQYYPSDYAVIQNDAFISDGISPTYGIIGLEPDTLLLAAFSALGLIFVAGMAFSKPAARSRDAEPALGEPRDAPALLVFLVLATWLTIGWLGPSLTRLLMILPCLVLFAALLLVRVWDDIAALWPPLSSWIAAAASAGLLVLACAQGFSNLFLLAGRSERAMQHFGAPQTIMGMFVRSLPADHSVVVLHTLRVDTLTYLIGTRPRVKLLTDTRKVSLDDVVKTPHTVTFVVEYARPFAEPLRALMTRFPQGDMTQVADARLDPDKPIFFTFTLWKDANGNVISPPEGGMTGGSPASPGGFPPGGDGMSFPDKDEQGRPMPPPAFPPSGPQGGGQPPGGAPPPPGGSPPPPPN